MNFRIDQLNYLQIADISISHHSSTFILNDDVILSWDTGYGIPNADAVLPLWLFKITQKIPLKCKDFFFSVEWNEQGENPNKESLND